MNAILRQLMDRVRAHLTASDPHGHGAALTAHVAAADPHTGYAQEAGATFTGQTNHDAGVRVGGASGAVIPGIYRLTTAVDLPSIAAGGVVQQVITDAAWPAFPAGSTVILNESVKDAQLVFSEIFASAVRTIRVRVKNTSTAAIDEISRTWSFTVISA